jgi:hypothetical protein
VPSKGISRSRAVRAARIAPSALRYGLPGDAVEAIQAVAHLVGGDPVRVERDRLAAAQRLDEQRNARVRAAVLRAIPYEGDGGGRHGGGSWRRSPFTSNDRCLPAHQRY